MGYWQGLVFDSWLNVDLRDLEILKANGFQVEELKDGVDN